MTNKTALIIVGITVVTLGIYLKLSSSQATNTQSNLSANRTPAAVSSQTESIKQEEAIVPADKIEVVHFHATQQCVSCITVGKFAKQTIDEKFPEEVKTGKIVFKEINAELPENQAIVNQYQARGSSLFVNAIRNEQDNIAEDTTVWRLVNSESQYITYFEGKLNSLLGK